MKKLMTLCMIGILLYACTSNSNNDQQTKRSFPEEKTKTSDASTYDPKRGEGKFDAVEVGDQLDVAMAKEGKTIADVKCASCHKYTEERLVGPGWAGVSEKHKPEWIMNFITNPDPMIDKDPELQAQLELCLVRMPNQNLSETEARSILEFMRQNDGVK
ncbi:cytochrome c [Sphingobacterium corticibacterium]|uniref:Cytochrome c n=2 Tax=Sphingobacterium corticibacterium TaxID=2484746 RepID=A0A4Q6XQE0_9SPHI|nr:cytochrome c [Sphingobacterium corticibacterium]